MLCKRMALPVSSALAIKAMGISETDSSAQSGQIAENLRALYLYMLDRLTTANVTNDARIVAEAASLVRKVKSGWDKIVTDQR